jgi:hypothetical protein
VEIAALGSFIMEDGSVVREGRNSGQGGGVYAAVDSVFTMKGSAAVSNTDVYLEYDTVGLVSAKINFSGALTAFPSIARITPGEYLNGIEVLTGNISYGVADNYRQLEVTPDAPSAWDGQLRHWRVNSLGKLEQVIARRMINGKYESYTSLHDAFSSSPAPPSVTPPLPPIPRYIELVSNVELGAGDTTIVESGYYIDLSVPAGTSYTIKRSAGLASSVPVISIQQSASLTLGAPAGAALIIDGGAEWDGDGNPARSGTVDNSGITTEAPLIQVSGAAYAWAALVLNDGVSLRNNDRTAGTGDRNGGAVFVEQGSFIMNGGTITRNRCAGSGGGVYFGQNFDNYGDLPPRIIQGGRISENHARRSGGGISLAFRFSTSNVEVQMKGGEITANRASALDTTGASSALTGFGGGVFIPDLSNAQLNKFIMSGGSISGNISDSGKGNGVVMDGANNPAEIFELGSSAYIHNSDDIVLHYESGKYCYITLNGNLSSSLSTIRISLDSYPPSGESKQVLSQSGEPVIRPGNLSKFEVGAGILGNSGYITMP